MRDYNRTLWENNKTVVDAENLNNIEDQLLTITSAIAGEIEKVKVIEDTLPMKANVNHTHDDLATIADVNGIRKQITTMSDRISSNESNVQEAIKSINTLKDELKLEFKKYYDNAVIENNTLKLYSNNVLLTSLKLPVGQAATMKSICGNFLCGEANCDDYPVTSQISKKDKSYTKTLWKDGVTPVNALNLNKIEDKLLELSQKLKELSEAGVDLADNFIHIGSEIPTSIKGIWIDNSDNEELALSNPIVEQFAETIKKQQSQIAELFYLTDAYLDDGLFEDENDDTEEFDGGVF